MGIVTKMPADTPTTNSLDDLPDDLLSVAPAYLSFGTSPAPLDNPPEIDEVRTYLVRVRCNGKTEKERTDGEMRHGRQLSIQAVWLPGHKPPAADDDDQPALFDDDGEPTDEEGDEPGEFEGGPEFSDGGQ